MMAATNLQYSSEMTLRSCQSLQYYIPLLLYQKFWRNSIIRSLPFKLRDAKFVKNWLFRSLLSTVKGLLWQQEKTKLRILLKPYMVCTKRAFLVSVMRHILTCQMKS
ncbi:hypothetical protein SEVIR_8G243966v4 [Setaria viridis]